MTGYLIFSQKILNPTQCIVRVSELRIRQIILRGATDQGYYIHTFSELCVAVLDLLAFLSVLC